MSVLVIHSVHELHQLKKDVAPSPGNFDYKYELTIQYTGFFISYAFTCVLRADAFCLFYNIKNFFDSATNHTLLYRYGAERGIHTFYFITERGCDCETVRLPKDDTVSVRL